MDGNALHRAGASWGAGVLAAGQSPLGAAVAAAVVLHAVLLLVRLGPSASSHAAPAAAVMAVRVLPATAATTSTPDAPAPIAVADTSMVAAATTTTAAARNEAPTPTVERAEHSVEPGPTTPRNERGGATATGAVQVPNATVSPIDARDVKRAGTSAAAAEAPPSPDKALPAAPDYAFGVRLDPGPRPLDSIEPEYPDAANLREGTVVLRLLISDTGHVDDVAVVRAEPRGVFEQSALEAFARARFAPGLAAGTPVKSQITVEVQFVPINRGSRVSGRTY